MPDGDADEHINRDHQPEDDRSLSDIAETIGRTTGQDFPGAPGRSGPRTPSRQPPPSIYAFYLPWHDFPRQDWGIYLLFQGINSLGRDIHGFAAGWLTLSEARRVARMFLFHHEAYHNVSETFAARLEVSHRQPCYRAGFRNIWSAGFGVGMHEEGLANAYAFLKVRSAAFTDILPKGPWRTFKRQMAAAALKQIIRTSPPPYDTAMQIIDGRLRWDETENEFQEANHTACGFGIPSLPADIWGASGHVMHPSLGRNRKFSYVIDRNHPALRKAAQVPHFARQDVIKRLKVALNITEAPGGRHPHVVTPSGKRVPVPGHRELERGTTRSIIRQLGLGVPLSRFMEASDVELRAMGQHAIKQHRSISGGLDL